MKKQTKTREELEIELLRFDIRKSLWQCLTITFIIMIIFIFTYYNLRFNELQKENQKLKEDIRFLRYSYCIVSIENQNMISNLNETREGIVNLCYEEWLK